MNQLKEGFFPVVIRVMSHGKNLLGSVLDAAASIYYLEETIKEIATPSNTCVRHTEKKPSFCLYFFNRVAELTSCVERSPVG
jgi:hypothetical protein